MDMEEEYMDVCSHNQLLLEVAKLKVSPHDIYKIAQGGTTSISSKHFEIDHFGLNKSRWFLKFDMGQDKHDGIDEDKTFCSVQLCFVSSANDITTGMLASGITVKVTGKLRQSMIGIFKYMCIEEGGMASYTPESVKLFTHQQMLEEFDKNPEDNGSIDINLQITFDDKAAIPLKLSSLPMSMDVGDFGDEMLSSDRSDYLKIATLADSSHAHKLFIDCCQLMDRSIEMGGPFEYSPNEMLSGCSSLSPELQMKIMQCVHAKPWIFKRSVYLELQFPQVTSEIGSEIAAIELNRMNLDEK